MRDEAIALWHRLVAKQEQEVAELTAEHERQKAVFGPFMQHACNIDVAASYVDDLVRRNSDSFEQLRDSLEALNRSYAAEPMGTGVNFDPGSKPFMQ